MQVLGHSSEGQGLAAAAKYFESQMLEMPFIPPEEKRKIIPINDKGDAFGTTIPFKSLYGIDDFVKKILSEPVGDFVFLGSDGYGINNRPIHYYALKEHLALFVQLNARSPRETIDGIFHAIGYIFEALAQKGDKIPEGKRLLIIQSDIYPDRNGYGWIQGLPGNVLNPTWKTDDPLLNSLIELDKL